MNPFSNMFACLFLLAFFIPFEAEAEIPPNVRAVLKSDYSFKKYLECLLDKGPCTQNMLKLKSQIAEALQSDCAKCKPDVKQTAEETLMWLYENKRKELEQLQRHYDPKGVHHDRLIKRYHKLKKEQKEKEELEDEDEEEEEEEDEEDNEE